MHAACSLPQQDNGDGSPLFELGPWSGASSANGVAAQLTVLNTTLAFARFAEGRGFLEAWTNGQALSLWSSTGIPPSEILPSAHHFSRDPLPLRRDQMAQKLSVRPKTYFFCCFDFLVTMDIQPMEPVQPVRPNSSPGPHGEEVPALFFPAKPNL